MKQVSIKKIGVFSFLKFSILVFGGGGFLAGLLFALALTPVYTGAKVNGESVGGSYLPAAQVFKALTSLVGLFTMYGIAAAIILTIIIFLFNQTSRFHGGVKVYIEKED